MFRQRDAAKLASAVDRLRACRARF